jgi:hypothetical protein
MIRSALARVAKIASIALVVAAIAPSGGEDRAFADGPDSSSLTTAFWEQVQATPPARTGLAIAYDERRGVSVVFGGRSTNARLEDTWSWDGSRWGRLASSGPSARNAHSLTFDTAHGKVLLFGGDPGGGPLGDTWEWSGTAWTQVATLGPMPRTAAAMAFDTLRMRAVLFGGESVTTTLGDTWEWDGDVWTPVCTNAECQRTMPSPRSYGVATYDIDRGKVVVFGGISQDGTLLDDTWEWDGARWTHACTSAACAASRPSARWKHAVAYDRRARATILYGGEHVVSLDDMWSWDGSAWKVLCVRPCSFFAPGRRSGHAMSYDSARQRTVLVSGNPSDGTWDTWEWDGTTWAHRVLPTPGPRSGHAMASDTNRGRIVLFGGGLTGGLFSDTWEWDGSQWLRVCTDPACTQSAPMARLEHALAFDAERGRTVLLGGWAISDNQGLGDTWEWDGAKWLPVSAAFGPRFGHSLTYDSARHVTVLFGGQSGGGLFDDTWEWNGIAWASNPMTTHPSSRSRQSMAFDAKRGRTVLFGGVDNNIRDDTWEWDGVSWEQMQPTARPPPRANAALAYDRRRGAVVLFGGMNGPRSFDDTWEWDGTVWTEETTPNRPPARAAHAMAYDDEHAKLILYGGLGENGYLDDTWQHQRHGEPCHADTECETGHCVDNVCCTAACNECEACNAIPPGVCAPISNREDGHGCVGKRACDAKGRCRKKDGEACGTPGDCISHFCVDGVCCATECTKPCQACGASQKQSGPDGICGDVEEGKDPHDDCSDDGVCSCAHDGACNGLGACRLYPKGTACRGCASAGNGLFDNVCDGLGSCVAGTRVHCDDQHTLFFLDGTTKDCSPYRCSTTGECLEACRSNHDCAAPYTCDSFGACTAAPASPSIADPSGLFGCSVRGARGDTGGALSLTALGIGAILLRRTRLRALAVVALCGCRQVDAGVPQREPFARASQSDTTTSAERALWESRGPGPPARSGHAMTYDEARGVSVLFGGFAGTSPLDDTWEWNGLAWTPSCTDAACASAHPARRFNHAMAFDTARGVTVLFGGQGASAPLHDTWEWNGRAWRDVCADSPCASAVPDERFGHAMVYDGARGRVVLFGGTTCAASTCSDRGDTWEWDGATWSRTTTSGPARTGHAMTYDRARAITLLFGGVHNGVVDDTWEFDGAIWSQVPTTNPPPARSYAALAYDAAGARSILFGGAGVSPETWVWDGSAWSQIVTNIGPSARSAHALAHDEKRHRLVLYGGFVDGQYLDDTWEELRYGGRCNGNDECATGACLDGVCCRTTCGTCESCNADAPGDCRPLTDSDDADSCAGDHTCDSRGRCGLKNGAPCGESSACASGYCIDGVCCATSCTGRCQTCRAALKAFGPDGICGDAASGQDPHDDCLDDGSCSCLRNGACDGAGACAFYAKGADCTACRAAAAGAFGFECDGLGTCSPTVPARCVDQHVLAFADGETLDCNPYRCTQEATCRETCASSSHCNAPYTCNAAGLCDAPPSSPSALHAGCQMQGAARARSSSRASGALLAVGVALAFVRCRRARRRSSPG